MLSEKVICPGLNLLLFNNIAASYHKSQSLLQDRFVSDLCLASQSHTTHTVLSFYRQIKADWVISNFRMQFWSRENNSNIASKLVSCNTII